MTHTLTLLEITHRQARLLFEQGIVIYIVANDQQPDTAFNTFTMRNDTKDASLNMYLNGRDPKEVPFDEYVTFIEQRQAEPVHFYTLNSTELYQLPYNI